MKKIGFIGAFDKTDLVLYVSKVLLGLGHKVLFIDATTTQKCKYVIPKIENAKSYITDFEGIDIAVGMKNFDEIKQYLQIPQTSDLPYDMVLIDTNSAGGVASYRLNECDQIYFATSMDIYSLKKGIESLSIIPNNVKVTKVLFSRKANKEEDDYINYLSQNSNIEWEQQNIYFPFESGDLSAIQMNQRVSKIKINNLTGQFREALSLLTNQITDENDYKNIIKVFRKIEKDI